MRYYAGIGSRETPPEILEVMWAAARTGIHPSIEY